VRGSAPVECPANFDEEVDLDRSALTSGLGDVIRTDPRHVVPRCHRQFPTQSRFCFERKAHG
jgi:hypothetical protein